MDLGYQRKDFYRLLPKERRMDFKYRRKTVCIV